MKFASVARNAMMIVGGALAAIVLALVAFLCFLNIMLSQERADALRANPRYRLFASLKPGMTDKEVIKIVGDPSCILPALGPLPKGLGPECVAYRGQKPAQAHFVYLNAFRYDHAFMIMVYFSSDGKTTRSGGHGKDQDGVRMEVVEHMAEPGSYKND